MLATFVAGVVTVTMTRTGAVMMVEGIRDCFYRSSEEPSAPQPAGQHDFGSPEPFVPQRQRVLASVKTPAGFVGAVWRLASPWNWPTILRRIRAARN